MDASRLLKTAILPALDELKLLGIPDTTAARRLMLAIALQESGLQNRRQVISGKGEVGPARGWWQFERGGGCHGVLTHRASKERMLWICDRYTIGTSSAALWEAIHYQDIVAAAAARLLVYTLPDALPTTVADGWAQYIEAWRPGQPWPGHWSSSWYSADAAVKALE